LPELFPFHSTVSFTDTDAPSIIQPRRVFRQGQFRTRDILDFRGLPYA